MYVWHTFFHWPPDDVTLALCMAHNFCCRLVKRVSLHENLRRHFWRIKWTLWYIHWKTFQLSYHVDWLLVPFASKIHVLHLWFCCFRFEVGLLDITSVVKLFSCWCFLSNHCFPCHVNSIWLNIWWAKCTLFHIGMLFRGPLRLWYWKHWKWIWYLKHFGHFLENCKISVEDDRKHNEGMNVS